MAKRKAAKPQWRKAPRKAATAGSLTPYLVVSDAAAALAWYQEAFGAEEVSRSLAPDGKVMHAEMRIGGAAVFLSDVFPGSDLQEPLVLGGTSVNLHIHAEDADGLWQRAVDAGATVTVQLANQFWGERYGKVTDPFGHSWAIATEGDLSADERIQAQALRMLSGGAHLQVEPSSVPGRRRRGRAA